MRVIRALLLPLAILYNLVTRVRNHLYDIGYKRSFRFERFVVSVGNLNVGGAGKTPMIEYLIRLLSNHKGIATLSRGYGRVTNGLRFASAEDTYLTLGDEPFQFYLKFAPHVKVTVGEDRVLAIPSILMQYPDVDIILMDDGFQHRAVDPQLSILLTEYDRPFTKDFVLPTGNLREARRGAKRADVILVTKCPPEMIHESRLVSDIRKYAGNKPVFFSAINYGKAIPFRRPLRTPGARVILVTGIANADHFETFIKTKFELVHHFRFGDHHAFKSNELQAILQLAKQNNNPDILTTEKDMVRLVHKKFSDLIDQSPWFYIPIEINILKNGSEFDELILNAVNKE